MANRRFWLVMLAVALVLAFGMIVVGCDNSSTDGDGGSTSGSGGGGGKDSAFNENEHSYEVINQTMSWTEAKRYCERLGGFHATITSSGEQAFIENLLAREGTKNLYWLGGYCGNDRIWQWVTGERFGYSNWYPGEPSGRREDKEDKLLLVRVILGSAPTSWRQYGNGGWNDGTDTISNNAYWDNFGFICEWE